MACQTVQESLRGAAVPSVCRGAVRDPPHQLAVLPLRLPVDPRSGAGHADAVLLARLPLARVRPPVRPDKLPLPVLLTIEEVALILPAVRPPHHAPRPHAVPV